MLKALLQEINIVMYKYEFNLNSVQRTSNKRQKINNLSFYSYIFNIKSIYIIALIKSQIKKINVYTKYPKLIA